MSEHCHSVPFLAVILSIHGVLGIFTFWFAMRLVYYFCCKRTDDDNDGIDQRIKYFACICQVLCVFSSISLGMLIVSFHNVCPFKSPSDLTLEATIIGAINSIAYSFTLISVNGIFAYRVYLSFADTIYQLSKNLVRILILIFSLLFIISCTFPIIFVFNVQFALGAMTFTHVK